jgi:hypothetical protein
VSKIHVLAELPVVCLEVLDKLGWYNVQQETAFSTNPQVARAMLLRDPH